MKIQIDGRNILEISEIDRLLLQHELLDVDAEVERRLKWIITHKIDEIFKNMKEIWDKKFSEDVTVKSVPVSRDDYVKVVTRRTEYKNCAKVHAEREKEEMLRRSSKRKVK